MKVRNADTVLDKTDFNNQTDWETYPTADYTCDNCNQMISLSFKDLTKHAHNDFSNLSDLDRKNAETAIKVKIDNVPSSSLDFYCPTCKRAVSIYYDSWAGGHHGEMGFNLKYVVDKNTLMNNVIISQPRILDTILLEDKHEFNAYITIGLEKKNDFYVFLEFINLDQDSFKIIAELSKMAKAIKINSEVIRKEEYNISHIVVTKFTANSEYEMTWECLSDDPNFSLEL